MLKENENNVVLIITNHTKFCEKCRTRLIDEFELYYLDVFDVPIGEKVLKYMKSCLKCKYVG